MLSNAKIKVQTILEKGNARGLKYLDYFIWLNSSSPKYNICQAVRFSDNQICVHRVCNDKVEKKRIKNVIGKITNISAYPVDRTYEYQIKFEIDTESTCGTVMFSTKLLEKDIRLAPEYRKTLWSEIKTK